MTRDVQSVATPQRRAFDLSRVDLREAAYRVLRFPAVADKTFLITIGDRIGRRPDQPRSDGRAVAGAGERCRRHASRTTQATRAKPWRWASARRSRCSNAPASGRLAVAEADHQHSRGGRQLAVDSSLVRELDGRVRRAGRRRRAVRHRACGGRRAVSRARHRDSGGQGFAVDEDHVARGRQDTKSVVAPVSLIVSAFAPVGDVRQTLTPQLRTDLGATSLWLIDLGAGRNRLGGSALAQVYGEIGDEPPDLDDPQRLKAFAAALAELRAAGLVLAYHDRSDGGLFATLVEMAFAGHCGLDVVAAGRARTGCSRSSSRKSSAR